ncbi:DUF3352 domain-containing protein [Synechocystis sp. LKSZ1]|uniref:DUF3352 domain-containing protein n=1 Tax=Synechocystis sp. LKSZ1 TaxID=3144951 RepID=UPI00336BECB7
MTSQPRSLFVTLALAVFLLFSLAGLGFYWILAHSSLPLLAGGVERAPITTAFIPKQSSVVLSLLVNPDRLESFAQLVVDPQRRRRTHREIRELEQSLLAKTGLEYEREVQPWLGEEMTLAVTDLDYDHQANNGIQPGYLLVVHSKDPQLSREFLQLAYARASIAGTSDLVYDTYQGVNLTYQRPRQPTSNSNLLASAVVGDYVLFANHPRVLRQSLASLQAPGLKLDDSPAFQAALQSLDSPRIALLYANFPVLSAWLSQQAKPETPALDQTLTLSLALRAQGLVAKTALTGVTAPPQALPALTQPVSTLSLIPNRSGLMASGHNLQALWQQIQTGLAPQSPLQQTLERLVDNLQNPLGLDLAQDIFAWVQGDYSLMLLPGQKNARFDWAFVAERLANTPVEEAFAHLDNLAHEQGYETTTLPVREQSVRAWTKLTANAINQVTTLEAQVRGAYLLQDERVIFATSLEALSQVLQPEKEALINSETFLKAISALPTENQGYVYIDWPASETFLAKQFPFLRVVELSLKPLFNNLRSLTLASEGQTENVRKTTAYFNLGVQ